MLDTQVADKRALERVRFRNVEDDEVDMRAGGAVERLVVTRRAERGAAEFDEAGANQKAHLAIGDCNGTIAHRGDRTDKPGTNADHANSLALRANDI